MTYCICVGVETWSKHKSVLRARNIGADNTPRESAARREDLNRIPEAHHSLKGRWKKRHLQVRGHAAGERGTKGAKGGGLSGSRRKVSSDQGGLGDTQSDSWDEALAVRRLQARRTLAE